MASRPAQHQLGFAGFERGARFLEVCVRARARGRSCSLGGASRALMVHDVWPSSVPFGVEAGVWGCCDVATVC